MLKQRLLTALLLIPAAIAGVVYLPSSIFSLLLALIVFLGAWEWAALSGLRQNWQRMAYLAVTALVMVISASVLDTAAEMTSFMGVVIFVWLLLIVWMALIRSLVERAPVIRWGQAVTGLGVLVPSWLALSVTHEQFGGAFVLLLFAFIWMADSTAYFAGKYLGKHKLVPVVSPGKTWEGAWGGVISGFVVAILGATLLGQHGAIASFMVLGFVIVVFSIAGDLFESVQKRWAGVKDSGALLPGHGGVLDRIDSLTSTAPLYWLGLVLIGVEL